MIDRAPNLDAARTAAAALDVELDQVVQRDETSSDDVQPTAPASSPLASSRAQLVMFGAMLVGNLSTSAARRWGAHWVYSEGECKAVATAALDVADLYLDELDGPWTNLAIILAATAIPRMLGAKLPPLVEPASTSPAPASPAAAEQVAA